MMRNPFRSFNQKFRPRSGNTREDFEKSANFDESTKQQPSSIMKRPFGFKGASKFLSDALGQCSSDEEKVKLISVLTQNSNPGFSNDEEDSDTLSTGSSDSEDLGFSDSETETRHKAPSRVMRQDISQQEDHAVLGDEATPCDPVASTSGNLDDSPQNRRDSPRNLESPTTGYPPDTTADRENLEWIFTLYDFDGSGKVTKEDIFTLVRSIYEVLGSTKIPRYKNEANLEPGKGNFGALKLKLSVLSSDDVEPLVADNVKLREKPGRNRLRAAGKRRSVNSFDSNRLRAEFGRTCLHEQPITEFQELPKRPRKPLGSRNHGATESTPALRPAAIPQIPARLAKPKQILCSPPALKTAGQRCLSCSNYRDYVNLSELENCCSHHHNQSSQHPAIHHVRHCDRHCNCSGVPNVAGKYPEAPGAPNIAPESGDYARLAVSPNLCCPRPSTSVKTNVLQNMSSSNRARNMAYYSQRAGGLPTDRKETPKTTNENLPNPGASHHEKKHRNRQKEKLRAMQQVKEWIMKESALTVPQGLGPGKLSEAHGGMVIEHRHVHEHHHYVHQD